jgi:hypothetical protein
MLGLVVYLTLDISSLSKIVIGVCKILLGLFGGRFPRNYKIKDRNK